MAYHNEQHKEETVKTTRILVAAGLLCALVGYADAFDTAGKLGMGFRFWGTPIITFSSMKVGVTNRFGLEPSAGYYGWKDKYTFTDPFSGSTYTTESTSSMLLMSLVTDIKAILAERSNFVVRLGGAYASVRTTYTDSSGIKDERSTPHLALLGGIGIEHFVNPNFSVNVGTLSGYWTSSEEDDDWESSLSLTSFNNQLVDLSLVWYLQ